MNTICPFFNTQSSKVLWWFWRIYWVSFIFLKKEVHYTIVVNMTNPGCQDFFHLHCVAFLKILGFFYCLTFSLCDYLVDSHKRNHFIGRKTEDIVELSKSWRTGWRGQNTNWTNEVYIYFNLWCYDFVVWVDSLSKIEAWFKFRDVRACSRNGSVEFRGVRDFPRD